MFAPVQFAVLAQAVPQAEPLHAYGAQDAVVAAGHEPFEQFAASVSVAPLQLSLLHETVGYVHAVGVPVQEPPHGDVPAPVHCVRLPCGCPDVTVVHVPWLPATSHAWHWSVQDELQQKPSTHAPDVHSRHPACSQSAPADSLQLAPCAFCGVHVPFAAQ
jgi:hypothetical protein